MPDPLCCRTGREYPQRLVAALVVLRDGLDPVIEQLLAGELDQPDRDALAAMFRLLAGELSRVVEVPVEPAGEQCARVRVWPGWLSRGRFWASGR